MDFASSAGTASGCSTAHPRGAGHQMSIAALRGGFLLCTERPIRYGPDPRRGTRMSLLLSRPRREVCSAVGPRGVGPWRRKRRTMCSKHTANSLGGWSLDGHILRLRQHCKYEMPAPLAPQCASQLRKVASVWLRQSCRGSFAMAGSAYTPSTPWADEAAESSKSRMSTQASASMAPRADWSVCCNRSDTRAPTQR